MRHAKAEGKILASAIVVFSMWGFRTLYELGKPAPATTERKSDLKELTGLSVHPAHPAQFIVGFGFVFFVLSVGAMAAPELAGTFAVLVAVGTTLANGSQLFKDISTATSTATTVEKGPTTEVVNVGSHPENQKTRSHA